MRSLNKVIIIGNLTRDPVMRKTQSDQPVCTFGLASNRQWVTQNSEKKSSTEFHECVAWAKMAEICHQYLKKGKLVYVEGYLKTRSWEDETGNKKFKTEIVVKDMIMLEKRPKSEENLSHQTEENSSYDEEPLPEFDASEISEEIPS